LVEYYRLLIFNIQTHTMTKNQTNRKEMQSDVLNYLDSNTEKWNSIPIIGTIKSNLSNVDEAMESAIQQQAGASIYLGKNKAQLKRVIAEKADILNDQIETYASINGDLALEAKMNASMSDFTKLKNEQFVVKVQEVVTEAENNMDGLSTDYGVNTGQVDDLKTDLDSFRSLNGMPRAYQINKRIATTNLAELFTQSNQILERLDKAMKIFKHRNRDFYNGYLAARIVIDN